MNCNYIQKLENELVEVQQKIVNHSLYNKIDSLEALQIFMQYHIFPVFDFMSLLKALQISLTQTKLPWIPKGNPKTRRLINQIVLGEETDVDKDENPMSHYEMYLEAMEYCGADTSIINSFVQLISQGKTINESLKQCGAKQSICDFVNFTFDIINTNQPHKVAGVFTFGREDLIPNMFIEMIKGMQNTPNAQLEKVIYYLERHIELDGDEHGPLALEMIKELCGNDEQKWKECTEVSKQALQHRLLLWNSIEKEISSQL